jgi:hypothetical protein
LTQSVAEFITVDTSTASRSRIACLEVSAEERISFTDPSGALIEAGASVSIVTPLTVREGTRDADTLIAELKGAGVVIHTHTVRILSALISVCAGGAVWDRRPRYTASIRGALAGIRACARIVVATEVGGIGRMAATSTLADIIRTGHAVIRAGGTVWEIGMDAEAALADIIRTLLAIITLAWISTRTGPCGTADSIRTTLLSVRTRTSPYRPTHPIRTELLA